MMETKIYKTIDRVAAGWPSGPWDDEPDKVQWQDEATKLPCLAVRGQLGSWCGYVGIPPGHPLYGEDWSDVDVRVHGGPTYSNVCRKDGEEATNICHVAGPGEPEHVWWFGFDCAHAFDAVPRLAALAPELYKLEGFPSYPEGDEYRVIYRTLSYVQEQCAELARQLVEDVDELVKEADRSKYKRRQEELQEFSDRVDSSPDEAELEFTVGILLCGRVRDFLNECNFRKADITWFESSGLVDRKFVVRGRKKVMEIIHRMLKGYFDKVND